MYGSVAKTDDFTKQVKNFTIRGSGAKIFSSYFKAIFISVKSYLTPI
jgi:hypothetical protein